MAQFAVHFDWINKNNVQAPVGIWNERGECFYPSSVKHLQLRGNQGGARPESRSWADHLELLTAKASEYGANWAIVESEYSLTGTMEAIGAGFLATTDPGAPDPSYSHDAGDEQGDDVHVAIEPASRYVLAQSWHLASELVRRHPGLVIYEMHPGGGMYDVLRVTDPRGEVMNQHTRIMINRAGTIQVHHDADTFNVTKKIATWAQVIAAENPHRYVKVIEAEAGIGVPLETPASRPITLAYRFIAALLNITVNDRHRWDCRNEYQDSSDVGQVELLGTLDLFPSLQDRVRDTPEFGLPHEPESHYWVAIRDGEPVAAISSEGRVYLHHRTVHLLPAYEGARRSMLRLVTETMGDLL